MRAAIGRRVSERSGFRVIPVLLPGSARPERSKLPTFLAQTTWVEFRQSVDEKTGLHRLKSGALPGSADWPRIVLKPGSDPLESLAVRLAKDPAGIAAIEGQLRTDPTLLHKTARFMLQDAPEDRRLVVLVDQLEEVFTLCRDPNLRRAFIDTLLHAANEPLGQTLVPLTMRADFYGKCAEHDVLAAALADHQLLVGPCSKAGSKPIVRPCASSTG